MNYNADVTINMTNEQMDVLLHQLIDYKTPDEILNFFTAIMLENPDILRAVKSWITEYESEDYNKLTV